MSKIQSGWRSCPKCQGMHFAGFPGKGVCPAGGQHDQTNSFAYAMEFDSVDSAQVQTGWASCPKCQGLFFGPFKGRCPAGGEHSQEHSFNYAMLHDVEPREGLQLDFRSCPKCQGLFFGPFKGRCPAGGEHSQDNSFNYAMRVQSLADILVFDDGPLTSDLPLGGSVHIAVKKNGNFTFSCDAHDSGFDNIDYVASAVLMTPTGIAFTFQHSGSVEGTIAGLPFGTPNRDSHFVTGGSNSGITPEFDDLSRAMFKGSIAGKDTLVEGVKGALGDLVKEAAKELGKAGAAAIIALVF